MLLDFVPVVVQSKRREDFWAKVISPKKCCKNGFSAHAEHKQGGETGELSEMVAFFEILGLQKVEAIVFTVKE